MTFLIFDISQSFGTAMIKSCYIDVFNPIIKTLFSLRGSQNIDFEGNLIIFHRELKAP